jgi:[acyl-carrier-protein] S-malonyltransferase
VGDVLALLAPGQGAQTPGLLAPWLTLPDVRGALTELSEPAGFDLIRAGTDGTAEEIRDTRLAQPLLVATGVAVAAALFPDGPPAGVVLAGHSVGELTVAAVGRALTPAEAVALAHERARVMAGAAGAEPGGMTAVLGGEQADVLDRLAAYGLTAANINLDGQVVAAGPNDALARLAADPPAGSRLRPLAVAGAFHTPLMRPAMAQLAEYVATLRPTDPVVPVVANADGAVVLTGGALLARLVTQIASPVRWDLCLRTLADLGVDTVIELPPAGILVGLARRGLPGVRTVPLRDPDSLAEAAELVAAAEEPAPAPALRLVVAPESGVFHRVPLAAGATLSAGSPVGTVRARQGDAAATAPGAGVLVEWLAADGDPVRVGQPLARLEPV